jgi:hypothetical protein
VPGTGEVGCDRTCDAAEDHEPPDDNFDDDNFDDGGATSQAAAAASAVLSELEPALALSEPTDDERSGSLGRRASRPLPPLLRNPTLDCEAENWPRSVSNRERALAPFVLELPVGVVVLVVVVDKIVAVRRARRKFASPPTTLDDNSLAPSKRRDN